jgi:hypothetical protein
LARALNADHIPLDTLDAGTIARRAA